LIALYAVVLAVGLVALGTWIAAGAIASSVDGRSSLDPEARFGPRGRMAIGSAVGLGMGGLSATYAGWDSLPALLAAVAAAGFGALIARVFGPTTDQVA
jgi:hypothetical protein